jgi:tetratricopeptide (TPR) repeat protein
MKNNSTKYINMQFLICSIAFILVATFGYSQVERKVIREGNKFYNDKKYDEAELNYKRALKINPDTKELYNNIGASQYRNGKFFDATTNYQKQLNFAGTRKEKADAFYNIGNSYLAAADYEKSIQAYKNALKLDPTHDMSRYNMAVATKIQESGGSGSGGGQQKQQQEKQDQQNKDQKNKDNKDEQKDENQQNKNKDGENKDKKQDKKPQPKDNEMSREEMEQFLESLQQKEKDVQDKVKKEKFQAQQRVVEKEW